jgi:predicted transcriptional regulator
MSRRNREIIASVRAEQALALVIAEGLTTREVAARLNISQSAASRALRRAEALALARLNDLAQTEKMRQIERLTLLYRESMAAWRQSKQDRVTKRSRQTDARDGGVRVAEVKTEESAGDARFLECARSALADMRKLVGLDRVTVEHLHTPVARPAADLTEDELEAKLAEFAIEHQKKSGGGDRPH